MRDIVILGSTGSIGVQALEVIAANPTQFRVVGLSAGSNNLERLIEQVKKFEVPIVGTTSDGSVLRDGLPGVEVIDGADSAKSIAALSCDVVLNGITGSIGLGPTLAALEVGNKVALANKESLVAGGDLVMAHGRDRIIPVDSEHSALYQAMLAGKRGDVEKFILTASGGPFRNVADLSAVTLADALNHPTWSMGPVVTINSATLVNKGLEIIEAHFLFDIPYSKIDAVIHPQSVVHSMVEFKDGSTIAQASPPNMKGPISYAIGYPDRVVDAMPAIDWKQSHTWSFEPIDNERFPAVDLARRCGALGGSVAAMYNAANEIAVSAFMQEQIPFTAIVDTIEETVTKLGGNAISVVRDLSDVSAIEKDARRVAQEALARR
ncbi:MAG: 1-deoxy-D-xylulose-5-phosphate reductoisomerase [Candidatus Nanopelagicaceae bacterium]|nr:1-deoxy-D-xylulose-5-phosphate reductoisomerase [Candidatus Nanopelagicaceae bacterium]